MSGRLKERRSLIGYSTIGTVASRSARGKGKIGTEGDDDDGSTRPRDHNRCQTDRKE